MMAMLQGLLAGYAFFVPITLSVAEPLGLLAVACWIAGRATGRLERAPAHPLTWPILVFVAMAVLASVLGVRPATSIPKLSRFLLLGLVWVLPAAAMTREQVIRIVRCFVAGALVKALYDLVRIPSAALGGLPIFQAGNMREPQLYAVALLLVLSLVLLWQRSWRDREVFLALLAVAGALLLYFKRGAWVAFLLSAFALAMMAGHRRALVALILVTAGLCALPIVRERVKMADQEFTMGYKGRYPIWTQAAPALIRQYPFGMGWKAPRHEDLRRATKFVQPKLNHLHNNLLQVTLELGWAGLAAWVYWMVCTLIVSLRSFARSRTANPVVAALALGVFGGLVALLLNGVVEYNFGDSEIFMCLCLLMGLAVTLDRQASESPA